MMTTTTTTTTTRATTSHLESAEGDQEFFNLIVRQVVRQTPDEDLMRGVLYNGRNHA